MTVDLYTGNVAEKTAKFHSAVRIHRRCGYRRLTFAQRIWTWSRFTLSTLVELLFRRKPFDVFAVTNPPFNMFTAWFLNRTRGIPYHLLVFDVYPDAAIHYSSLKERSLIARLWCYFNRLSLKHARSVFTISERMREALVKYAPADAELQIIHNWADNQLIRPIERQHNPFLCQLNLQAKRIVLYSGNFGKTHDIRSIVEAARLLVSHGEIHFLLIGEGEQKLLIEELIASYQLKNVTLLPFTDSQVFPFSVASGEIAIVTLDAAAKSVSTPSKTYNSMAAGSAIVALASTESELADLVAKHALGVVVAPADSAGLADAIEQLFDDEVRLNMYRGNSRLASNDYTPRNAELYVRAIAAT